MIFFVFILLFVTSFESLIQRLSDFVTSLDHPALSQCLHDIKQVKYDGILTVKCHSPDDPNPDVRCELRDGDNGLLLSVGRFYLLYD